MRGGWDLERKACVGKGKAALYERSVQRRKVWGWKACVAEDGGERFPVRLERTEEMEMAEGWLETRGPREGLG